MKFHPFLVILANARIQYKIENYSFYTGSRLTFRFASLAGMTTVGDTSFDDESYIHDVNALPFFKNIIFTGCDRYGHG